MMLSDQGVTAGRCEYCGRWILREDGGEVTPCDCSAAKRADALARAAEYFERKGVSLYFRWLREHGYECGEWITDDNFRELKRNNERLWRRRVADLAEDAVNTGFIR